MAQSYVITRAKVATLANSAEGYGLLEDAAIVMIGDRITWVGPEADLPPAHAGLPRHNHAGRVITPALIDCHTHIVHGGNRAREFEMRLNGASYEEIARAGGGIVSTVAATRGASEVELLALALPRIDALIAQGVGTVEIKSGYGLDIETELKMLRVARALGRERPITVVTSFLGAHAVPAGAEADAYIDTVCLPALEAAHAEGLVDAVDGFCEGIAFDTSQIARVLRPGASAWAAGEIARPNSSATSAAPRWRPATAPCPRTTWNMPRRKMPAPWPLREPSPSCCRAQFYTIHETQAPPVQAFRDHGVPIAVATDWNPGSSPLGSLLLAMNMACTLFRLTPAEALAGTTRNAARALGLTDRGVIAPGMRADLAIWDITDPAELSYGIGINPLHSRIFGGAA